MTPVGTGRCVCEALRYRLDALPLFTHVCHCLNCQKTSDNAFSMTTIIMREDLAVTDGEMTALIPGPTSTVHGCATCRTRVYIESSRFPMTYALKPGTLDDTSLATPQAHIWVKRKQRWLILPPDVPCFDENYDAEVTWPAASVARVAAAMARHK
jgi:hypothetical protein